MQGNREKWKELCGQAAIEDNPEKLIVLIREINRLLEENEQQMWEQRNKPA